MANYARTNIRRLHLEDLNPDDLIAQNFRLYELTRSEIADRLGLDNRFESDRELQAAVNLARQVLQPIRDAFGSFTPNSVYRSQALERVLKKKPAGWISTSQHTSGCACDLEIVGKPTLELAEWARDNLAAYDQIICECYDPEKGPNSGWVHISLKPEGWGQNRENLLSYIRDPVTGRMVYVEGLTASPA